jgi:dihydroorotate dehydrogenase (NAD+) catalytic subunit
MPKFDLALNTPILNAAGSLGFALDPNVPINISHLGAFVTNPISARKRTPARGPRLLEFPGGFLLHTGYPNPGLGSIIRRFASHWRRSPLPVLVHLLVQSPAETFRMVEQLESVDGVMGIELGLPPETDINLATELVNAAVGELPVIVRLPLEVATELAPALTEFDLAALSLSPPRGALPGPTGELVHGRLYGPAVFPLALATVEKLVETGIPIIGAGGVYNSQDAEAMLSAGAFAVQLDTTLWRIREFRLWG